jgi:hypothetical protein
MRVAAIMWCCTIHDLQVYLFRRISNRIGADGFLNQRCALTPDLESISRARTGKIVLQHGVIPGRAI